MSNTTLRTPESYLDEVAKEYDYKTFFHLLRPGHSVEFTQNVAVQAMRRMCEDAFKAQKEICEKHCGSLSQSVRDNILEAPTPFDK